MRSLEAHMYALVGGPYVWTCWSLDTVIEIETGYKDIRVYGYKGIKV